MGKGCCRAHCITKAEGNKKVLCEDRMVSLRGKGPEGFETENLEAKLFKCSQVRSIGWEWVSSNIIIYILKVFQILSYYKVSDSEVMVHVDQVWELVFIQDSSCVSWKKEPQGEYPGPAVLASPPETPVGASFPSLKLIRSVRFHAAWSPRQRPPPVA